MTVVGPRTPIGSEVKQHNLAHLRHLDVTPGVTGLWEVQGRPGLPSPRPKTPSDIYVENWSLWLDFKIIAQVIWLAFKGPGSDPGQSSPDPDDERD